MYPIFINKYHTVLQNTSHLFSLLHILLHDRTVSQRAYYKIYRYHGHEIVLLQIKLDVHA
jgi:hypothetical protein